MNKLYSFFIFIFLNICGIATAQTTGCTISFTSGCSTNTAIDGFTITGVSGTEINTSATGCTSLALPPIQVLAGDSYGFTLTPLSLTTPLYTSIFVDWNSDGDYLDPNEFYDVGNHSGVVSSSIMVPAGQTSGVFPMMVLTVFENAAFGTPITQTGYCSSNFFAGEIEEYSIEVANVTCSLATPVITTVEDCANNEFDLVIDVTSFGSATELILNDLNGSFSNIMVINNITPLPLTIGTYTAGTIFDIEIEPNDDAFCNIDYGLVFSNCTPSGTTCTDAFSIDFNDCEFSFFNTAIQPNTFSNVTSSGNGAQWFTFNPSADATINISSCDSGIPTDLALHEAPISGCAGLNATTELGFPTICLGGADFLQNIAVTAGTNYYIEWGNGESANPFDWTIDYTCNQQVLAVSANLGVDTTTEVILSFTPPSSTSYLLEYGPEGFTPGTGTIVSAPASPYTVTSLLPNTSYDFYVVSDCFNIGSANTCATPQTISTTATCIAPTVSVFTACNSTDDFQLQIDISDAGALGGNTQFDVLINGVSSGYNLTAGIGLVTLYASYTEGTLLDVSVVGNNDPTCFVSFPDITKLDCVCYGTFFNDDCINADPLTTSIQPLGYCYGNVLSIQTDLSCGNFGTESSSPSCDSDGDPTNNRDVFYEFIAPDNGNISLTINQTTNDINIAIYETLCPGVGGIEFYCEPGLAIGDEIEISGLIPMETYYLQLWANEIGASGSLAGLPSNVEICIERGPETVGETNFTPTSITVYEDCADSIFNYSNLDTTPATVYPSCDPFDASDPLSVNYDGWFEFTAPANGAIDLYMENTSTGGYTYYALYESDVYYTVGTEIECEQGFGISAVINDNISNLTPGAIYLLQVWTRPIGTGVTTFNTFDLCVSEATCVAPTFTVAEDCYGSTSYNVDVTITNFGQGNPNGYLINIDSGSGFQSTGELITAENVTVTVIGNYNAASNIEVQLVGLDDPICPSEVALFPDCNCFGNEPVNDECIGAITLNVGNSTDPGNCNDFIINGPFDNTCATQGIISSTEFEPIGSFAFDAIDLPDGWFATSGINFYDNTMWFAIPGNDLDIEIELTTTGLANALIAPQIALFDGCPNNNGNLIDFGGSSNPNNVNGNSLSFPSEIGTTYYLLVDHFGVQSNSGQYNLSLCAAPPPCLILNASAVIQSNPCNPTGDGTFFITANFQYEQPIGSEVYVYANDVIIDTITIDTNLPFSFGNIIPIPASTLIPLADLTVKFEFALASFCFTELILEYDDLPNCPVKSNAIFQNAMLNGTANTNIDVCSDELVNFEIEVSNGPAYWPVNSILTLNGNFIANLNDANNDGIYNTLITAENTGCAPIVNTYVVETYTDDYNQSGTLLFSNTFTVTVYPNEIDQNFNVSFINYCTALVTINPLCGGSLVLNGPDTQTGSSDGVFEFDYQYTSTNTCFDNTGTLLVPYSCFNCPLVSNVNFSETELCEGDLLSFSAMVDMPSATNVNIVVTNSAGTPITNLFETSPGIYTANINATNNGCAPLVENYTITATCTDNNALLNTTSQQVTIYPSNVEQFLDIVQYSNCSAIVEVSDLCSLTGQQFLIINAPNNQNASQGTTGSFSFPWQYNGGSNGCFNEAGVLNLSYDCPILIVPDECAGNSAGIVSSGLNTVCFGDFAIASALAVSVSNGNGLTYGLYDGTPSSPGNIYAVDNQGVFTNNGQYPTNTQLCISAFVGQLNGNSLPTDVCDVSNCLPVVFFDPIEITNVDELCNNTTNEYTVSYTISGGAPAYNPTIHTYDINIAGQNVSGIGSGQTVISNPISNPFYTIEVEDDGKGCGTSFTTDSIICNELPVELLSFNGFLKQNGNLLKWQTATEQNNDYFEIGFSKNGLDFEMLDKVESNASTSGTMQYEYLHENLTAGTVYYQLSQTDLNGYKENIGTITLVRNSGLVNNFDLFPNPAKDILNIKYVANNNSNLEIEVINNNGKVLQQFSLVTAIGNNTKSIDCSAFASGLYFIKVTEENQSNIYKFVKE